MIVATVGRIKEIRPIEDADRIEAATVICGQAGKWDGVVQKGQFKEGDKCNVFLPDALLPQRPEFAFMEKHHWRVRIARFRGAPSECLIMELMVDGEIGDDVAPALGVIKYEKPIPASMQGDIYGNFPSFIPKTDEPNFQVVPEIVQTLVGKPYVSTVKYDGTSCTVYKHEGHFGVCSRNWEMKPGPNVYWKMAEKYELEKWIPEDTAYQFEIIGPSIQSNPLGLKDNEIRLFAMWDINGRVFYSVEDMDTNTLSVGIPYVEIVESGDAFPTLGDDELRSLAEGYYPNHKPREGIVIRSMAEMTTDNRLSFKVVNPLYKD
jgi:RNA ligase (TIGR02306 family)